MLKALMLVVMSILLMACSSTKRVYNPNCLEIEKELVTLKNEKKFNLADLLTKVSLNGGLSMVNERSLDQEIKVSEMHLTECSR